jgi:hypothetical protein
MRHVEVEGRAIDGGGRNCVPMASEGRGSCCHRLAAVTTAAASGAPARRQLDAIGAGRARRRLQRGKQRSDELAEVDRPRIIRFEAHGMLEEKRSAGPRR